MSILLYNPLMDVYGSRKSYRFSKNYFRPATDVYESNDAIIVKMDLPGFKRENISIEATFNELEISSIFPENKSIENQSEQSSATESSEQEPLTQWFRERSGKNFYRKFKFSKPVNPQDARVDLEDGVLTISLPLRPEAKKVKLNLE